MMTSFKIDDFPNDPFELRGKLFTFNIDERITSSAEYIQQKFANKDKLYLCMEFMDYVYLDSFKGSFKEWDKHGGFPSIETNHQFDYAVKHAITGSYQAAFSHLRSCLELTLLSIYFSFEEHFLDGEDWLNIPEFDWKKAKQTERKWFDSLVDTPFFSKMLQVVKKDDRFGSFDLAYTWFDVLRSNYYKLSDYTHIKGYKMGSQVMNNVNSHFNNSSFHNINTDSLNMFLETLIQTIENIVILITLYNPIVLIELPLEEKFGINEPIGFIHPGQSNVISQLIPTQYNSFFENLKANDIEILGLIDWVNSFPDLTSEQIKKQLEGF
jgi:hypothetical protein